MKFEKNEPVILRRLGKGAPGEYRAYIKGISSHTLDIPGGTTWIVETIDKLPGQQFSYITITDACIDKID